MYFTLQWCAMSKRNDDLNSTQAEKTEQKEEI